MSYQKIISECLTQDLPEVIQCRSCINTCSGTANCEWNNQLSVQKKIWRLVGASSSQYQSSLASMNVLDSLGPCIIPWTQGSDRKSPGQPIAYVPRARTRGRPGGLGTSGEFAKGVDVKHNSYNRYLARKKGVHLVTTPNLSNGENTENLPLPYKGNKRYALGFINNCYIR
jgi:hypothetical protein